MVLSTPVGIVPQSAHAVWHCVNMNQKHFSSESSLHSTRHKEMTDSYQKAKKYKHLEEAKILKILLDNLISSWATLLLNHSPR